MRVSASAHHRYQGAPARAAGIDMTSGNPCRTRAPRFPMSADCPYAFKSPRERCPAWTETVSSRVRGSGLDGEGVHCREGRANADAPPAPSGLLMVAYGAPKVSGTKVWSLTGGRT